MSNIGDSEDVQTLLNESSTKNMLPNITRNESDMHYLKQATIKVENDEMQKVQQPRILLLSDKRHAFKGLVIPNENDEDQTKRENAKNLR